MDKYSSKTLSELASYFIATIQTAQQEIGSTDLIQELELLGIEMLDRLGFDGALPGDGDI